MTVMTAATLRQRAVRSAAWMLPASVGSRAVGLLGTLLLTRYLAPDEYGVVMAAALAVTTASSATTFGIGTYLVANAEISRAERFHASCWFLAIGVAVSLGMLMAGGPLERWSGAPGLAAFLPALIAATLLDRISYVPERLLIRNLRCGWLSLARAGGELIYTAVCVTLAVLGWGADAIVWGTMARASVRFLAIVPAVDIREWLEPHRLRLATLIGIAGYGLTVSLATMAGFVMRRWDNLLISRYFGAGVMGAYNYAYNLADTPGTAIGDQVNDILSASFPRVAPRNRIAALVNSCAMVSIVMLPLSIGLAVVAPTVVTAIFDPRWSDVGPMMVCLSSLAVSRPLTGVLGAYLYAVRRPTAVLWIECASLIGVVAAISTVGRAGITWACLSVAAVFVLRLLAAMWMISRKDGVPISAFLLPMARPLAVCAAMAAGVSMARLALMDLTPLLRLLVEIALGAAIYVVGIVLADRSACGELLRAVRSALFKGSTNPAAPAAAIAATPRVLSLSTEFPNPSEPGKGLFVRSRLDAIGSRSSLFVVAPIAALDYANPSRDLLAGWRVPRERTEGRMSILHPRWLYPPHGGWTNAFFLAARLLPLLVRVAARRPFDVIDAHFAHPEGVAAVLLGKIVRVPVLVTVRGSELRYYRQRWKRFWMSWALRRADRVIAVSENLRDLTIALGVDPQRVRTIPNGVDISVFYRRDRLECRSRHGIAANERIILSAGDLAELKGHHRAISAVKKLNESGTPVKLLIAGGVGRSGRYAGTLRAQVAADGLADRVTFLGEVSQAALAELMSAADVFCLASSTEGWPNVVNEALACGTPVVATDVGAIRQMVVGDRNGYVVPVQDGEALVERLREALTRRWDHDAISARGRARSWAQVADEVLEQMQAVIGERPRPRVETAGRALRSRLLRMGWS